MKKEKEKGKKGKEAPQAKPLEIPTIEQLEAELGREKYRSRFRRVMRNTVYALITVAAAAVLVLARFLRRAEREAGPDGGKQPA